MDAGARYRVFGRWVYPHSAGDRDRRRLDPGDSGTTSLIEPAA